MGHPDCRHFYHNTETYTARAAFGCDPDFRAIHGTVFIADILGGNKVVLVGSLIQDQMTRGSNWPFAAALAVVMMVLTTVLIMIYRKVTNARELEGIG